ncbi:hypothetical protein MM300_07785 [Evansella sp. LMS18]|uniref:hypothetical protein n=1 Tax=Evansella sp. LMS18 TaxID=2924033 RepID=UPI0020D1C1C6|nr:hypothetical protein [Evansella sp. LMS18]UTR12180.1 hypothetical protein MM300_07785 [Evansella sp. LMS18]
MKKLILFELKHTPAWNYIMIVLIAITFGLLASTMINTGDFDGRHLIAFDSLFIVSTFALQLNRYFPFAMRGNDPGTPFHYVLRPMPLRASTIASSRFISTAILLGFFYTVFFLAVYVLTPLFRAELPGLAVPAAFLFWLGLGTGISSFYSAFEAGTKPRKISLGKNLGAVPLMALVGGFLSIPLLLGMNLFYSFTGTGIVKGITVIAGGAPWAAAILGLVFFLIGFAFWKWRMNLSLNRVDYHV